jgi:PTH2 family peptidyl-tRNA hydrolase
METKQVIVIRKDLNMRKGKMVATGAHAAMWALLDFAYKEQNGDMTTYTIQVHDKSTRPLDEWLLGHYKKICVSVNSEQELIDLCEQAKAQGLPYRLQHDVGLTEFEGVRTVTCCAIGPGPADIIDAITGKLPLL